jgi:hypothetical protein
MSSGFHYEHLELYDDEQRRQYPFNVPYGVGLFYSGLCPTRKLLESSLRGSRRICGLVVVLCSPRFICVRTQPSVYGILVLVAFYGPFGFGFECFGFLQIGERPIPSWSRSIGFGCKCGYPSAFGSQSFGSEFCTSGFLPECARLCSCGIDFKRLYAGALWEFLIIVGFHRFGFQHLG